MQLNQTVWMDTQHRHTKHRSDIKAVYNSALIFYFYLMFLHNTKAFGELPFAVKTSLRDFLLVAF